MPLPAAHSIISASVYVLYKGHFSLDAIKKDYPLAGLFVFTGLFPDIDFITVPFLGFGSHRGLTHSFVFALAASSAFYALVKLRRKDVTRRLWLFLAVTAALHPICDFFTYDYLVERGGVMLLYPLSKRYYASPFPIFMGIELRYIRTILSLHTLIAVLYETLLTGAFLTAVIRMKGKKSGGTSLDSFNPHVESDKAGD